MELDYKKILLKTAVAAITSDGIIDQREITALKEMEKSSPYFSKEDLANTLDTFLDEASNNIDVFTEKILSEISNYSLSSVEELSLMEVSLTIIEADDIIEDSEKEFIIKLRSKLNIDDFILSRRFGTISYLGIENERASFDEFDNEDLTSQENN